tara:strand:+ start:2567 stop:2869 length:303 start_codon:yes stop_codon:yes gene_type:complete
MAGKKWTEEEIQYIKDNKEKPCKEKDEDLSAFGETKSIYAWSADARCVVTIGALRYRLSAGWDTKNALTKKPERSVRQNFKDWVKENHPTVYDDWYVNGY